MSEATTTADTALCRPAPRADSAVPARILLVDDDDDVLRLSKHCLRRCGYGVDTAADGTAAWQALQAASYDLLITDHQMPRTTGLELLALLRASGMLLPAILVSGSPPVEEMQRSPWLRPDATLQKPFNIDEYLGTVARVLNSARAGFPDPGTKSLPAAPSEPVSHSFVVKLGTAAAVPDGVGSRPPGRRARPARRLLAPWSAKHGIMELQTLALPARRRTRRSL